VEGFEKAGFFEKILPDKVEIFSKTRRAWTCFFEYPELIFALFFYFLFWINTPFVDSLNSCCKKDWGLNWKMVVFGKGVKFWGMDEKT